MNRLVILAFALVAFSFYLPNAYAASLSMPGRVAAVIIDAATHTR